MQHRSSSISLVHHKSHNSLQYVLVLSGGRLAILSMSAASLMGLPTELLLDIFAGLNDLHDVIRLASVSQRL